jgi:hypothetical protein
MTHPNRQIPQKTQNLIFPLNSTINPLFSDSSRLLNTSSLSLPPKMPSFQFQNQSLNFYVFIFIWIIVLIAFLVQTFLLFQCLKTKGPDRLSTVLLINIGFWCANTLCIMFFYTYAILWMDDENKSGKFF